ncbi:MAG TPA: formate dehydrogenase subunit gamma [Alphaproteobacteria bacterium]
MNVGIALRTLACRATRAVGAFAFLAAAALTAVPAVAQTTGAPAPQGYNATERPTAGLTNANDAALIRELKGFVSIPDGKAATLVQPQGREWRETVKGPIRIWGSWLILGMLAALILFYLLRGTIRIDHGRSGNTVVRFGVAERFTHWLTASSFVVLALTGLNVTYGRYVLLPILGPETFSAVSIAFKYAHNFVAFAFMIGLVLTFVIWVRHNIPDRYDLQWLAQGGGMFSKGVHPPARKFNAGQKLVFWSVIIGGTVISISGIYLLFPFAFGDIHTQQSAQVTHAIVSLILIAVIIAHIYIGTLGMEGAWDAMSTGRVDENWAREHHSVWYAELKGQPARQYGHD